MGCHFLLQGIFSTQGSNLGLLHCSQILYHLSYPGSPIPSHKKLLLEVPSICYTSCLGWSSYFENFLQPPHPLFHINSPSYLRFLWKPTTSLCYLHYCTYSLCQKFLCIYWLLALVLFVIGNTFLGVYYVKLNASSLVFSHIKLFSVLLYKILSVHGKFFPIYSSA